MFCKKCGKEIDYEATICRECEEAEAVSSEVTAEVVAAEAAAVETAKVPSNRMKGFGKALTGAIIGVIGFALIYAAFAIVYGMALEMLDFVEKFNPQDLSQQYIETKVFDLLKDAAISLGIGLGCVLASFVTGILSIVFGASSIKCFKKVKEGGKPIVTLILGIGSVIMGVCSIIVVGCVFVIIGAAVMSVLSLL